MERPPETNETLRARARMVEDQLRGRGIADERLLAAMLAVPRHRFVPFAGRELAYDDRPVTIGYGQTISQPYMVAWMLEMLQVEPGNRVLEIGAGSGYQAAVLGQMAAQVVGIELVPDLAERAQDTLADLGYANVLIVAGDGTLGYPAHAPFDRIIIAAASPAIPPPLIEQLAEGGRLVAPVGGRNVQTCLTAVKVHGELQIKQGLECLFVPLLGEHGWRDRPREG